LHWLSAVQVATQEAVLPAHWYAPHSEPGSVPAGTLAHVPTLPETLQAWHVPPHAALQHTPSTHSPLVHSRPAAQAVPLAFFAAHVPALQ
jgi:hypothetical protein